MSTDRSPIFVSFSKNPGTPRGNGLWKFKNSLYSNIDYTTKLENITDEEMIWEYIKYEIRKFSIKFSKQYAKDKQTKTFILEKKIEIIRGKCKLSL